MKGTMLVLFGLGAAAAVGAVLWWSQPAHDDELEGIEALAFDDEGRPLDERTQYRLRQRELQAQARNLPFDERDREQSDARLLGDRSGDAASAQLGNGMIDRQAAEEGFDHIMGVIEETARDHERLAKSDWRELYRAANDAFSALSIHLDAADSGDRELLEQAHQRLQDGLRRVRVRGRKFAPE
jgi:hypothetical protein